MFVLRARNTHSHAMRRADGRALASGGDSAAAAAAAAAADAWMRAACMVYFTGMSVYSPIAGTSVGVCIQLTNTLI